MQLTTQNRKKHQHIGNVLIYCSVLSVVNLISDLFVLFFYLLSCFVFRFGVLFVVEFCYLRFFFLFVFFVFYKLYFHVVVFCELLCCPVCS